MEQKIKNLLIELFKLKDGEITDSLTMEDLEVWDSLKHMEIIVAIEETFGLELTADEIVSMRSVGEIKRVIREKGVQVWNGYQR